MSFTTHLGPVWLLCAALAVPAWLLFARFGVRQNGRLVACLLVPLMLCFAILFGEWLGQPVGAPDDAEARSWLMVGFFVSALLAAIPAIVGIGIGFLMESRYGHRAP